MKGLSQSAGNTHVSRQLDRHNNASEPHAMSKRDIRLGHTTVSTPMACSLEHATMASAMLETFMPDSNSSSNWLGVSKVA